MRNVLPRSRNQMTCAIEVLNLEKNDGSELWKIHMSRIGL